MKGIQAFCAIILLSNSLLLHGKRIQEFTLYSGAQGELETTQNFTENVWNLDLVAPMVRDKKLQSVCSQLGVWAFFTGKNYSAIHSYGYHPATPDWTCSKRRISADYMSPFESIRHLGNQDLDIPSLSLYREPFFACQELFFHGNQLSLPVTTEFQSFGFTGRESWTLYKGPNFSGDSVCLQCKCDQQGISVGVTYTAKLSLVVTSIRKGCFGNQTLHPDGVLRQHAPTTKRALSSVRNTWPSLKLQNAQDPNASLVISGIELRLAYPETFDSFTISQKSNWSLYSDTDQGKTNPMCLMYSKDEQVQYFSKGPVVVGSIKLGCAEKDARDALRNNLTTPNRPTWLDSNSSLSTPTPRSGTTASYQTSYETQVSSSGGVTSLDNTRYETQTSSSVPTSVANTRDTLTPVGGSTISSGRFTTQAQPGGTSTQLPRTRQGKDFDLDSKSKTDEYSSTSSYTANTLGIDEQTLSSSRGSSGRPGPVYRRTTTPSYVIVEEIIASTNSARGNLEGIPPSRTTENPDISEKFGSTSSGRANESGNSRQSGGRAIDQEFTTSFARTTERSPVIEEIVSTNSARMNLLGNAIPTRPTEKVNASTQKPNGSTLSTESDLSTIRVRPNEAHKVASDEEEDIEENQTSTAGVFFIAFLVTLGFLILAMIVAIGICIYIRVTRTDQTEITE